MSDSRRVARGLLPDAAGAERSFGMLGIGWRELLGGCSVFAVGSHSFDVVFSWLRIHPLIYDSHNRRGPSAWNDSALVSQTRSDGATKSLALAAVQCGNASWWRAVTQAIQHAAAIGTTALGFRRLDLTCHVQHVDHVQRHRHDTILVTCHSANTMVANGRRKARQYDC